MARSSRHKSHRSHKHWDMSESDGEGNSRERKMKVEEEEWARVSDQEKRKSSSKDGVGTGNGDVSGDQGKKRRDRVEDSGIGGDRWNGGGDDDVRVEKESKKVGSDAVEVEKSLKSKFLAVDMKGKSSSSRRREDSNEKNDAKRSERGEEKRRSDKETNRRESRCSQYKDGKEKERERERGRERERERGPEKEKKVQDSLHERYDDEPSRIEEWSRREERSLKHGVDVYDLRDEMHTTEVEKELDKRIKRKRDGSGEQDRLDDVREGANRQVSSRDDHSKNGSYKGGSYREKYREELDRDQRHRDDKRSDDKRRDERTSRTHTSERSESKHCRDESKVSESRDKKTKLQDSDRDSSCRVDDHGTKPNDNRGRKRFSDEIEDHYDLKPQSTKEPCEDTPKNGTSSGKFDLGSERARMEHPHNEVDSSLNNSRRKNSPDSCAYAGKDQNRHNFRPIESTRRESLSEDAHRSDAFSRDHATASSGRERMSDSKTSDKVKSRDNIRSDAYMTDGGSVLHHDRIVRSDARSSPNQSTEKSPTSASDRRSDRITSRLRLDIDEGGQRSSNSKGGREDTLILKDGGKEWEYLAEKPNEDDTSQLELPKREHVESSSNRSAQLQGSSPGRLPPPPPFRYGVDSPSVLGSYEDEMRVQNGERKVNNRYKRDSSLGRGPGTPWKGAPTWLSTVANGFMSLPHGPPGGFHAAIQQFPAPRLFGIRRSMDLSNTSYHIREAGNRFPGHSRPYGWHNPLDDCPPQLQVWDGNTNVFSDESHIYGRQEWDQSRHVFSSSGWEMSTDVWNAQNGNANMDFSVPHKENEYPQQALADEAWVRQPVHNSHDELTGSEQLRADASGIKLPSDTSPAKQAIAVPLKSLLEKTPEPSNMPRIDGISEKQIDNNVPYCRTYLSKLDISQDLVRPELYKQCMSLMEVGERNVTGSVSSLGQRKNKVGLSVEGFRLVAKSKQYACNSFFPTATDATFQRAMALYRKQGEGLKKATRLANPGESNVEEKVAAKSAALKEESLSANVLSGDYMDGEINAAADVEGEHPQNPGDTKENLSNDNKPSDTKTKQVDNLSSAEVNGCGKISDAVISAEGSEESEGITPECRLNLSRIHLSPAENTH